MKIAVLPHSGCLVDRTKLILAIRQILKRDPPDVFLLDLNSPEGQMVQSFLRRQKLRSQDVSELRRQRSTLRLIVDFFTGLSDQDLLIRSCDKGLVFWDASPGARELVVQLKDAGKGVLRVDIVRTPPPEKR